MNRKRIIKIILSTFAVSLVLFVVLIITGAYIDNLKFEAYTKGARDAFFGMCINNGGKVDDCKMQADIGASSMQGHYK